MQKSIVNGQNGARGDRALKVVETVDQNKGLESRQWKRQMEGLAMASVLRGNNAMASNGGPTVVRVRNV